MNKKRIIAMVSTALLVTGCVEVGNAQTVAIENSGQSIQKNIVKSIQSQANPLKTIEPSKPFEDLKPLKKMIGNAQYVGLGENTHGSSEIFTIKFRLVKYLVTEMGFTNFALEEDWGNGLKLNEYIQTGKGNPREFLKLLYPTDEIIAMIEWMKDYNADPSNKKKIQFIGLDLKTLDQSSFNKVIDYVRVHRPDLLTEVEENYKELSSFTGSIQEYMKLTPELKEKFKANAERVARLLNDENEQANAEIIPSEYIWAKATASAIEKFTTMLLPNDYPSIIKLHEQYLADHAMWAQETFGGKTMVWAHNIHIAKGIIDEKLYPYVAGQFLKERLDNNYVTIGSTTTEGNFTLYSEYDPSTGGKITTDTIPQDVKSFNYTLGKVPYKMFLLDNRHLKGQAEKWAKVKRPLLSIGGQIIPNSSVYFETSLLEQFDIIFHIRKTSPSHIK
ncbi:erythromycin esterase family protein [Paenibacillus jamilae]|uniref:Erythromycin esterase n=1 Tax=Bacillus thuringiensis serovar subtoxicus TaxID=475791 RepID=A0A9X6FFR0_BACTU|nr:erythromycin esterase family protein [Bacillus thuringiensis]MEB4842197.1 erythromycin esterase family protein [Paenibacillus jamilae]MEB8582798.1 erythromycin esterase family protein [Bacillus cereus]MCR6852675.1 erythromycin esterase family protein [Bacillus thuringiensis]MDR4286923.1 erythromycin esterase family protein [Bacillus thuringiensis]MEB8596574.1 erythromycin esterase family protein [Bacillus cereus]